ncbi:hypothetical protein K2Q00_01180 [Patescibacteria group bacterium]|nr:hypothetical protein [Patescibacteria group bacterium]
MSVHTHLHRHFVPSHHNSYRPHILRKNWLLFFVAIIMAGEGMFVSGLYVQQVAPSVAVAESSQTAAVGSAASSFLNNFGKNLARIAVESEPYIPWALGIIGTMMTIAVLVAFFVHIQIQQSEMLFSGALVALFAFSLMITNVHILGIL